MPGHRFPSDEICPQDVPIVTPNQHYQLRLFKITRDQRIRDQKLYNSNVGSHHHSGHGRSILNHSSPVSSPKLCGDCDKLKYCQLARNLGHSHDATLTSHRVINGEISEVRLFNNASIQLPDQHIMAEKLKLRYKTCPFHRELSLGLESDRACLRYKVYLLVIT
jgi:hypothetical protein